MTTPRQREREAAARRAIGYCRVSTDGQVESGAGLQAQESAIREAATRLGMDVEIVVDAGLSGATLNRPALAAALDRLDRGEVGVLIAAKLDRVSRSVRDFAGLLERAQRRGWRLVLLDLGDTSTAAGEMTANVIASAAQYERRLIGQRTREGLAARQAAGVRLGRPPMVPERVVRRVIDERSGGRTLREIAEGLTADGERTARENTVWSTSSVQSVLAGQVGTRLRWIGAPEVVDGVPGLVHAYDLVTLALAHPVEARYMPQEGLLWREPLPGERCAECAKLVRAGATA